MFLRLSHAVRSAPIVKTFVLPFQFSCDTNNCNVAHVESNEVIIEERYDPIISKPIRNETDCEDPTGAEGKTKRNSLLKSSKLRNLRPFFESHF